LCHWALIKKVNKCESGDDCKYAHTLAEDHFHKDNYKTKYCNESNPKDCRFGDFCAFAHSDEELTIDLIHKLEPKDADFYMFHFKTVWCPYKSEHEHDKAACVYAHNL
jgi:hypothetical protein